MRDVPQRSFKQDAAVAALRAFLETSPQPAVLAVGSGEVLYANRPAEALLGHPPGGLEGLPLASIFADPDAGWRAGGIDARNVALLRRDGGSFPATLSVRPFEVDGRMLWSVALGEARAGPPLQEDLRRRANRLELLQWLAQATDATDSLETLFSTALGRLREVTPYESASIARVFLESNEVEFLAVAGERPPGMERGRRVALPVREALAEEKGYRLHTFSSRYAASRAFQERGFCSGVSVPLCVRGRVLGLLALGSKTSGLYDDERARELLPFANQLAIALSNQMLRDESDQRAKKLEQFRELDRAKTVFLSTVSHELKTPLVTVTGYLEMATRGQLGPVTPQQQRAFDTALRNTRRLDRLIDDVLDLTRLELGKDRVHLAPFDASRAIEDAIAAVSIAAQAKKTRVERVLPTDLPWAVGDAQRIAQVLTNLLSNAVKFSDEGRTVWVSASSGDGKHVEIAVRDEAIGIAEEHHQHIFESFYQVDGSPTRKFGGAGLGLAIVRSILQAHGSEIRVDSRPGEGARFSFSLPAAKPAPSPAGGVIPPVPSRPPAGTRILVVEDESEIQEFVKIILEMEGCVVLQARSGREAILLAERERPDLVLLDIAMAGLSGIDVCKVLRAHAEIGKTPIYMLSARTREEDRRSSMAAGADGFIRKPFTPEDLIRAVAEAVRR
jgi:PAS domain S-box-containing protein